MASVLERANGKMGAVTAARLSEDWMRELSGNPDLNESRRRDLEAGLDALDKRFPEVGRFGGSSEEFAQARGHGAGSRGGRSHEGRRRPASGKGPTSTPKAAQKSSKPSPGPVGIDPTRRRRAQRASRPRVGPRTQRLWRQTGVPSVIESGTSVTMMVLGAGLGLSIVYLILSSAEKPGSGGYAVPQLLNSITNFLHRFIAPVDLLGGNPRSVVAGQLPRNFQTRGHVTAKGVPKWQLEALQKAHKR